MNGGGLLGVWGILRRLLLTHWHLGLGLQNLQRREYLEQEVTV